MLWQLRYKAPRGVDDVWIDVDGDTEKDAMELAEWYLSTLTSPNVRFVYVRPIVVATSKQMRKALGLISKESEPKPVPKSSPADEKGADSEPKTVGAGKGRVGE